mgnify:CR=1 FL=1
MANVVDPNSWRMIPLPEPRQPTNDGRANRPEPAGSEEPAQSVPVVLAALPSALQRSFAGPGDRIEWHLSPSSLPSIGDNSQLRLDGQHELGSPSIPFPEILAKRIDASSARPWLVLVESADEVGSGEHSSRLRAAP